MLKDTKY